MENHIPTMVFQDEVAECGLACISMLASMKGIDAPLSSLRTRHSASVHGMTLSNLNAILKELTVASYPVSFEHEELKAISLPAILHYRSGHYVLLTSRKGDYFHVMNPALGHQILPWTALKDEISGYAIIVDSTQETYKRKNSKKSSIMRSMSLAETSNLNGIYNLMAIMFLSSLGLFIMPLMISQAINSAFSGETDFSIIQYCIMFLMSTLLAILSTYIGQRFVRNYSIYNSAYGFSRLLNNSSLFFQKRAPGDIFSRFSAWQNAAPNKIYLDNGLRTDWIIVLISAAAMSYVSFELALIAFGGIIVSGIVSVWAIFKDRQYEQVLQVKSSEQNDFVLESIQGFSTIKSMGLEDVRSIQFGKYTRQLFSIIKNKQIYDQVKSTLYQLITSVEMIIFMLIALPMLKNGTILPGDFFAYGFLRQIFSSYMTKIFNAVIEKSTINVIDDRASSLFYEDNNEPKDNIQPAESKTITSPASLEYKDVNFNYDDKTRVLSNVSLSVKSGECIAIVGESGQGKTTLLRLIASDLTPNSGNIILNGATINGALLKPHVFLQSQDDILFKASVLQNIVMFDRDYNGKEEGVNEILFKVNLDQVIKRLPGGINASIRDSQTSLSLGQRQRLLLARAFYSKKTLLILDEPTANLDEGNADHILLNLINHCRINEKVLVITTHNMKILKYFDKVYRIANGGIEPESGVHNHNIQ